MKSKVRVTCACGSSTEITPASLSRRRRRHGDKPYMCLACTVRQPAHKEKRRPILKAIAARPERRYALRDRIRSSPELRATLSKTTKQAWADGKLHAVAAAIRSRKNNPEYKVADAARRSTPEFKMKMSTAITAAFQNPDVARRHMESMQRLDVKEKLRAASVRRWQSDEYRAEMARVRAAQPSISSIQRQLYQYLDDLHVAHLQEGRDDTTIGYWTFDCIIPIAGRKLLVECQGEYWHGSPAQQARDKAKFVYIERYHPDCEIMYVFEHEFAAKDRVMDRLKLKLGIDVTSADFDFKDVSVRQSVSTDDVRGFLDAYHYLNRSKHGVTFCATINNDLIGVCVFSKPTRQNQPYDWELSRLCIHPSYHKKNFASWFISRCVLHVHGTIVAFADTTVGHRGTVYKAANFRLDGETAPDYWYVGAGGYVIHKQTLYRQASRLCLTESEFAERHGYLKKWGGKKLRFVYERKRSSTHE